MATTTTTTATTITITTATTTTTTTTMVTTTINETIDPNSPLILMHGVPTAVDKVTHTSNASAKHATPTIKPIKRNYNNNNHHNCHLIILKYKTSSSVLNNSTLLLSPSTSPLTLPRR